VIIPELSSLPEAASRKDWAELFGLSVTSIANAEKNGLKCHHPNKRLTMIAKDDILAYFLGYGF
jgi:hypothetical protein